MAFEPRPTFNPWNRQQQIGIAIDTPFTFGQTIAENFQQGILDSFGLGTVTRAAIAGDPRKTTGPEGLGNAIRGVGELLGTMQPDESKPLGKTEYESSPWFRDSIQWDEAFTEDRAAALAAMHDKKEVRARFSARQPVAAFLGQLGGQALDPVNYVPVFGAGVTGAAVARFGSVAGRALISASEATINTAAFGVLTSGIRAKYGDDTSWQSIATEVAMSAVIGGAFGGGIGLLARGVDRRAAAVANARPKLETIGNVMESRAVLNDAVAGLVDRAEVNLTPNSLQAIERMSDEVVTRTSGIRALRDETAKVTGTNAGEVVISPSGARVSVRPELVEARSLIRASGDLQVRDRSSPQSRQQVEDIAINLDPARLMPNVDASQGAPLVGADNVIDSGNGRVMAINRAYEAYPERAAAYRQALVDAGYADAATMEMPVLVNRRMTDLTAEARAQFNAEVNGPTTARMSAVELAAMDRGAVTDGVLDVLDDAPITAASNRAAVGRFLANLPANERGALVDASGALSADGARRVENALVASAYGDADTGVLRRFAEATDDNTRTIVGALSDVAGQWARMRRDIKAGTISPDFDLTPELTQAVRLLGRWREDAAREGRPVSQVIREGLAQLDLLDGSISPEAQTFIRMFYQNDHFAKAVGREVLAARLQRVIDATNELGRPSLFGDALMPSKGEVLTNAQREQADIFTADGLEPRPEAQRGSGEVGAAGGTGGGNRSTVEASHVDADTIRDIVDTADAALKGEAAKAVDDFVGHAPGARDRAAADWTASMGIMKAHGMEAIARGEAPEVAAELETAFAPVREKLRAEYGDVVRLHRVQQPVEIDPNVIKGSVPNDNMRAALSWSADQKFARQYAGVVKDMEIFTEADISKAEADFAANKEVKVGRITLKQEQIVPGVDSTVIYSGEEMITDTDSVRAYMEGENEWAAEHNAKQAERAKVIVSADVPLDEVLWVTDRAGQAEFIVRNGVDRPVYIDGDGRLQKDGTAARAVPTSGANPSLGEIGDAGIASAFPPAAVMEKVRTAREFTASQPARSLDETYQVIPEHQQDLDDFGRDMQELTGAKWRNPGIKDKASAAEKMTRKGYESTAELTDLVRGGFVVDTPAAADEIVRSMQAMFGDVLDEGWRMTAVNYFDRKVLVRFDDGTIGEVQFWHPDMIDVKESRGHALYEEARALEATDPSNPRLEELFAEQRRLYASALPETSPAWSPVVNGLLGKSSTPGNAARNAASLMGSPESITSTRDASFQPEFDLGTNSADAPSMMAARPSQLKNLIDGAPDVQQPLAAIDGAAPAPDPVPDGLPAAEARVGKGEDMRQLAESHGVSEDGSYVEQADIEQLRATGALTPEDEAELAAADQLVADADAYADTLAVAARCVIS